MRPGTADESFAGQQVRGSRISGQAAPGAWVLPDGLGQLAVDLAGDVALEAADDLAFAVSVRCLTGHVGAGRWVVGHADERDPVQRTVRGPVATAG